MRMHYSNEITFLRFGIVMVFACCLLQAAGQVIQKKPANPPSKVYKTKTNTLADTVPKGKESLYIDQSQLKQQKNSFTKTSNGVVDTVFSFDSFLQMKAGCEPVKTLGDNRQVFIRYPDGFTKIMHDGHLVEVITADGVRHVLRWQNMPSIKLAIIRVPPPVPGISDPLYKWLNDFNLSLEEDIVRLIGKTGWDKFLNDESEVCNNNIYKQIQFRTMFLENFNNPH